VAALSGNVLCNVTCDVMLSNIWDIVIVRRHNA